MLTRGWQKNQKKSLLAVTEGFVVKLVRGLWNQEEEAIVENADPIDLGDEEAIINIFDQNEAVKFKLVATVRHTGNNKEGQSSTGHFLCYLKHGHTRHCWNDAHQIESDVDMDEVRSSVMSLSFGWWTTEQELFGPQVICVDFLGLMSGCNDFIHLS